MLRVIGNDQNLPRQEHAVASGALTNGKPVVVNADGTVSSVAETTVTQSAGTPVTFNSGSPRVTNIAYDTNTNRVVIVYRDDGNSGHGTAIVGTVSGTSISFGSEVVFNAAETKFPTVSYDTNAQKVLVTYQDEGNSNYGTAIVGTVDSSDNSISFGSEVIFKSSATSDQASVYDPDSQKIVMAFAMGSGLEAAVATISGTSVSFGSLASFGGSNDKGLAMAYDTNADKVVISYRDGSDTQGKAVVGTVSGTSISFGSEATFESGGIDEYQDITYDASAQKVVIAYLAPSNVGKAIVGTVSGTSISFGTAATYDTVAADHNAIAYDPTAESVAIFYRDTTPFHGKAVSGKVSGTSITFTDQITFQSGRAERIAAVYDPDSAKVIVSYYDYAASTGDAVVTTTGYTQQNLTSENYIGIARSGAASGAGAIIDTQGAIADIATINYNLDIASFSNKSFNIGRNVNDIAINNDGTKIYYITDGSPVGERTLSTADDISTAGSESTFDTSSQDNDPRGVTFSPDGTKMYIAGDQNDKIYQYTLSTAFDVTSASYASKSVSSAVGSPFTTQFKSDGTKMYVVEASSGTYYITEYTLSTAFDVSTASYTSNSFNTSTQTNAVAGIFLEPDGTKLFAASQNDRKILQYNFGTAFDISTLSYSNTSLNVSTQVGGSNSIKAVVFNSDGSKMYVGGVFATDTIYQYSTTSAFTPAQSYYVQNDGTLGTTADDPSVFAGTAVSATELIVKG